MWGRAGGMLAAVLWILAVPCAGAKPAVDGLHLTLQWSEAGGATHRLARALAPHEAGGGVRIYRWNEGAPGCCGARGALTVERGDVLHVGVRLHNPAAHAATVRLALLLALPAGRRAPTEISGTLFGRVSMPPGAIGAEPGLASLAGAPVFALLMNGTEVASALRPPVHFSGADAGALAPQPYSARYGPAPGDGVGRNLAILLRLRLGPGATVSFHTQTRLAPSPFPVGVLALGLVLLALLVLVRWRRQARIAARQPAAHRAR